MTPTSTWARKPKWYHPFPEATAVIDCGGEPHRVTWRRGKIVLEAHDLASERAMVVFGGEVCPCMRVLDMWVSQFRMPPEHFLRMQSWLSGPNAFLAPAEFALLRHLSMVLTWERRWRASFHLDKKEAELLGNELQEKALPHLRAHLNLWKARTGSRVVSGCQVGLVPSNRPVTLDGITDGVAMRLKAQLHPTWVVDVWARGVATVDGAFVLRLTGAVSVDDLRVVAGRWEPTGTGTWATVTAPARLSRPPGTPGAWALDWDQR